MALRAVRLRERMSCCRHRLLKHQVVAWVEPETIWAGQSQKSPVAGEGMEGIRRRREEL